MSEPGGSGISGARSHGRALFCCLAVCALLATAPTQAEREDRQAPRREVSQQSKGQRDGAARAAAIAQSRYGGKVLKVTPQGGSYRVRLLLPDGTVKNVNVDAGD